jgi:hypothetical protein
MEVSGQPHALVALYPGKEPPDTHQIDPRTGIGEVERRKI